MHAPDRTTARCFVDTNVWLYAFIESDDVQKRATAEAIVQSCDVVISTQVINEACVNLVKKASLPEAEIRRLVAAFYEKYTVTQVDQDTLLTALEQAGSPQPPDQSAELQRRCDLFERGIREGLAALRPNPLGCLGDKVQNARAALNATLERVGLRRRDPDAPEPTNELKEKLLETQRHVAGCSYEKAVRAVGEALAMTDFLYHQNDPPMTDRAYQALERASRLLLGSTYIEAQGEIQKARKLLATEPSAAMVRGALKQARDLLISAKQIWVSPSQGMSEAINRQQTAIQEALVMLKTVLGDD